MTSNRKQIIIGMMVATFLAAMEVTIVSTAMPAIISDLTGIQLLSWVFSAYLLTSAVTTLIYGKLADLFGRKIIFTVGTGIFLVGSILCGLSETMDQLILFRAIQGLGAGAILPISYTIVGDLYSFEERAKMQAWFSSIWALAAIIGPLLGGFMVENIGWRWIFFINVPFGLLSIAILWVYFQEPLYKMKKPIDYWGAITFSVGMTCLLYVLLNGQSYGWISPVIMGTFLVSVIIFIVFIVVELRFSEPMLSFKVLAIPVILVSNAVCFFGGMIMISLIVYLPIWIQGVIGATATSAGLTLTTMSLGWPLGAFLAGRMMRMIGARLTSAIGMGAILLGMCSISIAGTTTLQWSFVLIMFIVGFGFGVAVTVYVVAIQSAVRWDMRGSAIASNSFVGILGQTIGIALFGTLFNNQLQSKFKKDGQLLDVETLLSPNLVHSLKPEALEAFRNSLAESIHSVFLIVLGIAFLAFIIAWWLPKWEGSGTDHG